MRFFNKKVIIIILSLMVVTTGLFAGCSNKKNNKPTEAKQENFKPLDTTSTKVVAEYNGGKITEGQTNLRINIQAFINPQFGVMFTSKDKNLINKVRTELAQNIAALLYTNNQVSKVSKVDFDKKAKVKLDSLEASLKATGKKNLADAIQDKGFKESDLKDFLVSMEKLLYQLDSKFQNSKFDFTKVKHILVSVNKEEDQVPPGQTKRTDAEAKKRIAEVQKKLQAGGDFAKLAKEYSDDTASKDTGGVYEGGPRMFENFVKEFKDACKKLPINKISDPVKTQFGYHIILVEERSQKTYKDASDDDKQEKRTEQYNKIIKDELKFKSLLPEVKPETPVKK